MERAPGGKHETLLSGFFGTREKGIVGFFKKVTGLTVGVATVAVVGGMLLEQLPQGGLFEVTNDLFGSGNILNASPLS